jgi:hypothetical protein
MTDFGWSYPPGCSGPPEEPDMDPHSEEVWGILEKAGVNEDVIQQVCDIVEQLSIAASQECKHCLERYAADELKAQEDLEKYWAELDTRQPRGDKDA